VIVVVVCMGAGIVSFAVTQVQRKLSQKNKVLEQAVERSTIALHQQEQELSRALEIQKDLLPKELPQLTGIELAGAWQPARAVGGDYFDVMDEVAKFCAGEFRDDVTLLVAAVR
jgi:nitrate/nitrite-specific signal transduction histidine kinase